MNYLLSLNKVYVLILSIVIIAIFLIFFVFKFYTNENLKASSIKIKNINADITEPKFAINNPSQKIFITAKEGNFIDDGKILLKKNVKFKSNNFSLESDNVTFDRNKETAQSYEKSIFKSTNTMILSNGFDIYDNGNKINFNGKTTLILK